MDNIVKIDFENNFSNTNDLNIIIDNDNLLNRHEFYNWNNATEYINSLIDSIDVDTIYIIIKYNGKELFRRLENDNISYMNSLNSCLLESVSGDIFFFQNTEKGKEYLKYKNPFLLDSLIEDFELLSNF